MAPASFMEGDVAATTGCKDEANSRSLSKPLNPLPFPGEYRPLLAPTARAQGFGFHSLHQRGWPQMTGCHDEKSRVSGGEGSGKCILSQSAACPAGGLSYKPEIASYSSLFPTPPKTPFIGPAALGLLGTVSAHLLSCCLVG